MTRITDLQGWPERFLPYPFFDTVFDDQANFKASTDFIEMTNRQVLQFTPKEIIRDYTIYIMNQKQPVHKMMDRTKYLALIDTISGKAFLTYQKWHESVEDDALWRKIKRTIQALSPAL